MVAAALEVVALEVVAAVVLAAAALEVGPLVHRSDSNQVGTFLVHHCIQPLKCGKSRLLRPHCAIQLTGSLLSH